MAGVLRQVAVRSLFADVVLLVVAVAFCRVERRGRRAAGTLVALVVVGNGLDGFCHCWSPLLTEGKRRWQGGRSVRNHRTRHGRATAVRRTTSLPLACPGHPRLASLPLP